MKKAILEITLKSDLCTGSGYSYGGIVDTDSVSNEYGMPVIPGRRLKGCMREAAEEILPALRVRDLNQIFGQRGNRRGGNLTVDNAQIRDYEKMIPELRNLTKKYSSEKIFQLFSSVRGQTKMDENGLAEDNSLRFTRVINHYRPGSDEEMVFEAELLFVNQIEDDLKKIVSATRAIGMKRNRGFGRIHCTLKNIVTIAPIQCHITDKQKNEIVTIPYCLTTVEPLMISNESDNVSEGFVPGRTIMGALAGRFLDINGTSAEDKTFRDLFLNGNTSFSNAYPDLDGERTVPAPLLVQRLKKTKKLVNVERLNDAPEDFEDPFTIKGGNQPKKLNGKYVLYDHKDGFAVKENDIQLIYHNRHAHLQESNIDRLLYSHLAIGSGQKFDGFIKARKEYAPLIRELMGSEIRIGKSKTAQYGKCSIKIKDEKEYVPEKFQAGEILLISLVSDTIIDSEYGNTVNFYDVYRKVAEDLNIWDSVDPGKDHGYELTCRNGIRPYCLLDTGLVHSYQTVWNLRRKPAAVLKAGSVLAYELKADAILQKRFVGERNSEGFGEIACYHLNRLEYRLTEKNSEVKKDGSTQDKAGLAGYITKELEREEKIRREKVWIQSEDLQSILKPLTNAALGRAILMLRESIGSVSEATYAEDVKEVQETNISKEFQQRVNSIKTNSTRNTMNRFLKIYNSETHAENLKDCWSEVLLTGLTYQKYLKAGEE